MHLAFTPHCLQILFTLVAFIFFRPLRRYVSCLCTWCEGNKGCGEGVVVTPILYNFGARWRWEVNVTPPAPAALLSRKEHPVPSEKEAELAKTICCKIYSPSLTSCKSSLSRLLQPYRPNNIWLKIRITKLTKYRSPSSCYYLLRYAFSRDKCWDGTLL
jgi:hypothetical protein